MGKRRKRDRQASMWVATADLPTSAGHPFYARFNLGLLMRQLTGVGTPRSLQGRAAALVAVLIGLLSAFWGRVRPSWAPELPGSPNASSGDAVTRQHEHVILVLRIAPSTTGC